MAGRDSILDQEFGEFDDDSLRKCLFIRYFSRLEAV